MKQLFLITLAIIYLQTASAQADTEFWFAAPDLQQLHGDRPILLRASSLNTDATVTISLPANPSFIPITQVIPANSSFSFDLTPYITLLENTVSTSPQNKGILITSTARITCYYDIAHGSNGDLYSLKGRNALGTSFTVPFQMNMINRSPLGLYTTDFIILATENNTIVQINSTANLTGQPSRTFSVTLQKGETFVCSMFSSFATDKPGGSIVTSNKPITITTKDDSIAYPTGFCFDTAGDQLIPDNLAGTEFILTKGYFSNDLPDYYYIFATAPSTTIKINGVVVATLTNQGNYYAGKLININDYIESDKPIQIFQISGFGCEVGGAIIPSIKCTGSTYVNVTRASGSLSFFVNVLSPANIINDFTLNGSKNLIDANAFQVVPNTSNKWYVARINVPVNVAGTNQPVVIENPNGKFHVSVIHGGTSSTTRFGYFSDFGVKPIQFAHANNLTRFLKETDTICHKAELKLYGLSFNATGFAWTGPNNYTSSDSFIYIKSFNISDTGMYKLTATTTGGCGVAIDSIRLAFNKPAADFNFTTTGCAGDSIVFQSDPTYGVKWLWNFGNGQTQNTDKPSSSKQAFPDDKDYTVSLNIQSRLGCVSDTVRKIVYLTAKPNTKYTIPAITCVNAPIVFTDESTIPRGSIVKWRWNLDDGNGFKEFTSNQTQEASYTQWGKKNVQLVTESQTGCISDTFRINTFTINPFPKPGFISPEVCLNDANATFINTTSSPDGFTGFIYKWDFDASASPVTPGPVFTAVQTTQKNPSVNYRKADNYLVKLIVNSRGCVDSIAQTFIVNGANPVPNFSVVTTPLCSNDSIRIVNNSTVDFGVVSRLEIFWDANDPTLKTIDENPYVGKTYAFLYAKFQTPASSNRVITLKAYSGNAASCSKSIQKTIALLASPKLSFSDMPGICINASSRQITQAGFDPAVPGSFIYKGNGVSSTGLLDPAAAGVGTHTMQYLFTANNTCKDSISRSVIVWPKPIADFSFSTTTCEKNAITFTDRSTPEAGTLTNWQWNFGDGTAIVNNNTNAPYPHTFSNAGNYNISLLVSTSNGCSSDLKTIPLIAYPLPTVNFDLPKVCLPIGKALFINKTNALDNSGLSYVWNYGDPNNTATNTLTDGLHYYQNLGSYPVKLIAKTGNNCVDSITKMLTNVFPQPKAGFNSVDSVCYGDSIRFTDNSQPLSGNISSWNWDLGNNYQNNTSAFTYTYPVAGKYQASFYITTSNGCISDTAKKTIWIHAYPVISAGPDLLVLDDGQKQLNASASGDALRFNWTPATYLSSTTILKPFVVKPQEDIRYTLTVTGRGNCAVSDEVNITALKLPTPPNTFTPNGDGINDVWEIKYLDQYPGCVVEIYNDAGQLMHRNVGYNKPWDGYNNGKALPAGTYYFIIDPRSGRKKIAGYITILR